jgi:hypothetical protein
MVQGRLELKSLRLGYRSRVSAKYMDGKLGECP